MAKSPEDKPERFTMLVVLNGTSENPWHRMGLTQNPFPMIAKAPWDRWCLHVQALGGNPIPDTDYIRKHLKDFSDEFVELCCGQFRKGESVKFVVHFTL